MDDKVLLGKHPETEILAAFKAMHPFLEYLRMAMEK
jgi:hypothetical protein